MIKRITYLIALTILFSCTPTINEDINVQDLGINVEDSVDIFVLEGRKDTLIILLVNDLVIVQDINKERIISSGTITESNDDAIKLVKNIIRFVIGVILIGLAVIEYRRNKSVSSYKKKSTQDNKDV